MADEVRRSGRANKGHHTKNADALDEPAPKPKPKGKPEKKAQASPAPTPAAQSVEPHDEEEEEEEEDAIYRCVCGDQREIRGREMIMCDKCEAWQHNKCLGLPDSKYWEDKTYLCEECKPEDHAELLAAMARGEKPWNRKKGSKAARPKFRPSDVGSEGAQEKKDTATPQPAQAPAPSPAPAPALTPTHPQAPTPARETPRDTSDGHVSAKSSKKATPKSLPQSPVGEKRPHEASVEKDVISSKRRKSSTQYHGKVAPQTAPAHTVEALPEKQRRSVEALANQLSATIKEASASRGYRIPDGDTPSSIATRLSLQIDHALVVHYGAPTDNSSLYLARTRNIIYNTKKNVILLDRLLNGSLSPEGIATMPPEQMASEDKQREYAAMNEANEKQMVLIEETGPRMRKTHKGEEIIVEDNLIAEQELKSPEPRIRESADEEKPERQPSPPKEDGGPVVELPEDVGRGAALSVETSSVTTQPTQIDGIRRPSTTFDINSVFDKVRSPQHDQQAFIQRRQSSIRAQQTPQEGSAVVDADIDRLLKDDDNDAEMTGYSPDPSIVWRGSLEMQSVGTFEAVARFVAGGDFGQVIPWDQLLSPKLPILGRIESQRGNGYIEGLATTGSHDVGVLAISAVTPEGQRTFDQIFQYFQPRDRWGVVPVDQLQSGTDAVRDLYVIPVVPGGSELPPFLNLLEYCTIETPRPAPMILLALVAKLPETTPHLPPAQHFERYPTNDTPAQQGIPPPANGQIPLTSPSPLSHANPHGPQYSPMQAAFPPNTNFSGPTPPMHGHSGQHNGHNGIPPQIPQIPPAHPPSQRCMDYLGPYFHTPVIAEFGPNLEKLTDLMLDNLRYILEKVPLARTDMKVLLEHVAQRQQGENGRQEQQHQQQ